MSEQERERKSRADEPDVEGHGYRTEGEPPTEPGMRREGESDEEPDFEAHRKQ
ncbi:MAG: hypothetical protein M3312_08215 [Actinomycetota bacterium]|nr:hypothetical protein [Actinomycetota bacterium]